MDVLRNKREVKIITNYWKCSDCNARFIDPTQDEKTILRCPSCKSINIDLIK